LNEKQIQLRTVERTRQYRDAILRVGRSWQEKEASSANKTGWKVAIADLWAALLDAAGSDNEALASFYV